MKKLNLLFAILLVGIIFACSTDEVNEVITEDNKLLKDLRIDEGKKGTIVNNKNSNSECIIVTGNTLSAVTANETRTFTVSSGNSGNFNVIWSQTGGIQLLTATTSNTITVKFPLSFTSGSLNVSITGLNFSCTEIINFYRVGQGPTCNSAPIPQWIRSEFGTPNPPGYYENRLGGNYLCTRTINNTLSVPYDPCVVSYEWSIYPVNSFGVNNPSLYAVPGDGNVVNVIVNQAGNYNVYLKTTNAIGTRIELFRLYVEDCNAPGGGF